MTIFSVMNNNQLTFPHRSKTLNPLTIQNPRNPKPKKHAKPQLRSSSNHSRDFAALPNDILTIIASHFSLHDVKRACLVCKTWRNGLWSLWEEMVFLGQWHNSMIFRKDKDRESFLYRAVRVSTLAVVDAGLVYWEIDKKENEGVGGGDHIIDAEPQNMKEAVKWLYQASEAGYVRQQYQLAFCLHRAIGTNQNMIEAARWYLQAAVGGHVHAMYEVAMCYASGRGIAQDRQQSRKWMKLSADHGHKKAQFEHGRTLFSKGARLTGAMFLELAERGGVKAATDVKDAMLRTLPLSSRASARILASSWRPPRIAKFGDYVRVHT